MNSEKKIQFFRDMMFFFVILFAASMVASATWDACYPTMSLSHITMIHWLAPIINNGWYVFLILAIISFAGYAYNLFTEKE